MDHKTRLDDAIQTLVGVLSDLKVIAGQESAPDEEEMGDGNEDTQDVGAPPNSKSEYTTGEAEKKSRNNGKIGLMLAFLKKKK